MGSAQSKPTNTQHSNKVNTHLKCMKHCYNAHVMQCMKFKDHFNKNPSQNFNEKSQVLKISNNFKNPKDRKSTRLNSSHLPTSRMPSSA